MKLWILSDLHLHGDLLTFGDKLQVPDADLCVIAGDLTDNLKDTFEWMARVLRPHLPVIYVLGNHDYFGESLVSGLANARQLAADHRILLLEDRVVTCGRKSNREIRLIGSTLWTDFALHSGGNDCQARQLAFEQLREAMPEFHSVRRDDDTELLMRPQDAYSKHLISRAFINAELEKPFEGKTVVITHHAPHRLSIPSDFAGSPINPAFASDLSNTIEQHRPDLWIHGHTHASFDYQVGQTRVVCNPPGNGKGNPEFDWKKVVNV